MSVFVKTTDGLLYHEDFSQPNSLLWTLSPSYMSNVLEFGAKGPVVTEAGLRIKHSNKYVTYLMPEPSGLDEYSVVFSIAHVPVSTSDIGGVIVMSSTLQYLECQTFLGKSESEMVNGDEFMQGLEDLASQRVEEVFDNKLLDKLADLGLITVIEGGGQGASGLPTDNPPFPWADDSDSGSGSGFTPGPSIPGTDSSTDESVSESENEDNDEEEEEETDFEDTFYRYIKVYKAKHKYYFYASADIYAEKWIEVGNAQLDTGSRIGLFLYGTDNYKTLSNGRFQCNWVDFYSSKYITLHGLDLGKDFVILSNGREVFRSDVSDYQHMFGRLEDTIEINTTELPVPINNAVIKVYARNNFEQQYGEYEVGTLYGGDVLDFMLDLRMYINSLENPIEIDTPYDLGTFYKGNNYVKLIIQNCDTEPATGLTVSIMKYSPYYEGEQEVYISPYEDGIPIHQLHFEKSISLDIQPSESKSIYVRLYDTPLPGFDSRANDFRFKVVLK